MRYLLFIILFTCAIPDCALAAVTKEPGYQDPVENFFVSKPALFSYGAIAGISIALGFVLLTRKKASGKSSHRTRSHSSGRDGNVGHQYSSYVESEAFENKYYDLESRYKKLEVEKSELIRQLGEYEKLSAIRSSEKDNTRESGSLIMMEHNNTEISGSTTLYYLQPATDGTFREVSKVSNVSDALYALTFQNNNPSEATLKFIDTKENTYLAVQNESNWILVACERSNIPTEQTTSIRTDIAGKAILRNREWEILQKAKITYL